MAMNGVDVRIREVSQPRDITASELPFRCEGRSDCDGVPLASPGIEPLPSFSAPTTLQMQPSGRPKVEEKTLASINNMSDRAMHSEGDRRAIPCIRCTKLALRGNSCIACRDTTWATGRPIRSCYKCYTNHDACVPLPEEAIALALKYNITMKTKGETDPGVRKLRTILMALLDTSKQDEEQVRASGPPVSESVLLESMAAQVGAAAKKIFDGLAPVQTVKNSEKPQQYRIPKRQDAIIRDHLKEHQSQPPKQEECGRIEGERNQSGPNHDSVKKRADKGRYQSQSPQQVERDSRTRNRSQSRPRNDRKYRSRSPRLDDRHKKHEDRRERSQSHKRDYHHRHHRSQSPHQDSRKRREESRERSDHRTHTKRTPEERRSRSQSPRRGIGKERSERKTARGIKQEEETRRDKMVSSENAERRARLRKLLSDFSDGLVDLFFS